MIRSGRLRRAIATLLALGGACLIAVVSIPTVDAQDANAPKVELVGAGSWAVNPMMQAWTGELVSSAASPDVGYLARGSRDGRGSLARGEVDFAVSGRPFDAEQLAKLKERHVEIIEAPISVSSIAFMLTAPRSGVEQFVGLNFFRYPFTDPDAEPEPLPFIGPMRMPHDLLARTMLKSAGNVWQGDPNTVSGNEEFLQLLTGDPDAWERFGSAPIEPIFRSDPSSLNYYLEEYLAEFAPGAWATQLTAAGIPTETRSEFWPLLTNVSRSGAASIADYISQWVTPYTVLSASTIAAVPVWAAREQLEKFKDAPVGKSTYIVNLENGLDAAGQKRWIEPTTASLTKAAVEGTGDPLQLLRTPVDGAYPLTYFSNIAVPSSGLGAEKANAIATMMRFAVTTGQIVPALVGEAFLPDRQVLLALEAANKVVASNCKDAGGVVIDVKGGGRYWPKDREVPAALSTVTLCDGPDVPVTPSTESGPSASSSGSGSGSGSGAYVPPGSTDFGVLDSAGTSPSSLDSSSTFDDSLGLIADDPSLSGEVETATGAAGDARKAAAAAATGTLPMGNPPDGRNTLDRLTTLLLGVAAFFVLRGWFRRYLGTGPA